MEFDRTMAAFYGKGVFTSVAIHCGQPFLWDKHWRRLETGAARCGIDLSKYSEATTYKALIDAITTAGMNSGRIRVTFLDYTPSNLWTINERLRTNFSLVHGVFRSLPIEFKLMVSSYRVNSQSPLAGIKSCNYLENILSHEEATKCGFQEAIRLNERGEVTSCCMANIFWLRGEKLYTPSLATGCLAGTTREFILENLDCEEVEAGIEQLNEADAIFLTSAGLGIVSVNEFQGRFFDRPDHPILNLIPPPD